MQTPSFKIRPLVAAVLAAGLWSGAQAAMLDVTVTVENLAPAEGVAFAPLHFGFNNGAFDGFDLGSVATAPIISVAENGSGSDWQPAFAMADPTAVRGTIGGLLLAGASAMTTVRIDSAMNPYFTFAAMVLPSNDFFIGNDSPTRFRIFDDAGNLLLGSIGQQARDVWDAGSEVFDPAAAAFVGDAGLHAPQNSVVAFNFAELAAFNGLMTGAGYSFTSNLTADTDIYRITFSAAPVPEPETYALMLAGLLGVGFMARRRRSARE